GETRRTVQGRPSSGVQRRMLRGRWIALLLVAAPRAAWAQEGGICEIDPSACPKQADLDALARRPPSRADWRAPPKKEEDEPQEVTIRSKPPPRSASDWEVDKTALDATPKENGADVLNTVPGVFV